MVAIRGAFWSRVPASSSAFLFPEMPPVPFVGLADEVAVGFSPVMEARRSLICRDDSGQLVLDMSRPGTRGLGVVGAGQIDSPA